MRAIIIEDKDAKALLDSLKLELFRLSEHNQPIANSMVGEIHGAFHYRVCKWLQDQGCSVL